MAGELGAPYPTGNTCYFWLLDSANRVRNLTTAAFEIPADANWTDYDIAAAEPATGFYRADMPPNVPAGIYSALVFEQAGGAPAVADAPARAVITDIQWDGSDIIGLGDIPALVWSYASRTLTDLSAALLALFFTRDTGETEPGVAGSVVGEILDGINTVAFPAGAISYTYTVTDSGTGLPVEGAEVWFATDAAYANIVWKGDTDAFGVARDVLGDLPLLDAGTYYVKVQRAGYADFDDTEVVS